jgi:hypothetical protein
MRQIILVVEVFTAWCRNSRNNSSVTNDENYSHSFMLEDVSWLKSNNNKFSTSLFSKKLIFSEMVSELSRYLSTPQIKKPMKLMLSQDSLSFIGLTPYQAKIEKTFIFHDIISVRSNFYDGSILIIKIKDSVIRCDTGLTLGAIPIKEIMRKLIYVYTKNLI